MKRTEIIIETQRVTVIQRRRHAGRGRCESPSADIQVVDVATGNNNDNEMHNNRIQAEEKKETCTDSRDR